MRRTDGFVLGLSILAVPALARAQSDVRLIRPDVMLLLDTSGSMEWMPGEDGTPPVCNPSNAALQNDRNRWNVALEVLTGSFEGYSCQEQPRSDPARIDFNYYIPHYAALYSSQATDGVLDEYRERVKFGLMTFDSWAGLPDFALGVETDLDGMWSYGDDRRLFCADCMANYTWNAGARNETAPEGALVSCGAGTDDSAILDAANARAQTEILASRPYWATPIAAMLDDADFYFDNHPDVNPLPGPSGNDPYHACRDHYVLLVTDGAPNVDGRPFCERGGCECPWLPADEEALELYDPLAVDSDQRPVLVIGYDVPDLPTRRVLWDVAEGGGTALPCDDADLCPGGDEANCASDISCPKDDAHPGALFAGCRDTDAATCAANLRSALSTMLDFASPDSTTRTRPAFTNSVGSGAHGQYQFNSAFYVASGSPWRGTLQRNRWECVGSTPTPVPFDGSGNPETDDFAAILNERNLAARPRKLWTAIPRTAVVGDDMRRTFDRANARSDSEAVRVSNATVTKELLGGITAVARQQTIDWMHGEAGTARESYRLGDIFHSNPAILPPPELNLPDASFRDFQTTPVSGPKTPAERPTILYVGSNDGILHAFDAKTGEELWGFIPPLLVPDLYSQVPAAHRFGVDGGVVARDVLPSASAVRLPQGTDWRTVVVFGLRQGGGAYVALDVTDWQNPKFLWQFAPGSGVIGATYGTPEIGTVFIKVGGTNTEKAVAVLTGGEGVPGSLDPAGCPRNESGPNLRGNVRCWQPQGRYLWIVDILTGDVIQEFDRTSFDAPVVGTPALFQSQHGTSLRRIFVTDKEGTLYRVDTADTNPNKWEVHPVFDLYHGGSPNDSVPSYEEPLLTVNDERSLVVVYGSGDPDNLGGAGQSRVASLTELLSLDGSGAVTAVDMDVNWEFDLPDDNEKLTGPMQLFDGALYFTTFIPTTTADNLCALGHGRVWGVDVIDDDGAGMPKPLWDEDGDPATLDLVHFSDLQENTVVFGVGVTRRPSCAVEEAILDDFGRNRTRLTSATPGEYKLVIQSGPGAPGPGWEPSPGAGAGPNVFERTLQAPERPLTVTSWVNVIED
jgi:type IV pilus assembly protein PilY1